MRVVANGCFDLFHDGHKDLLDYSFKFAGTSGQIIVLLNSDKSVRELKGEGRPLESFETRAANISKYIQHLKSSHRSYPAFRIVGFNSEEALAHMMDVFEPEVIIKGNDRPDVRDILGSDKYPVLITPRLSDEISTSKHIEKMEESNG